MSNDRWTWRIDQSIPSDTVAGRQMIDRILDQLKQLHWCPRDLFAVQLAMEEALVNAIKHGNGQDLNKRVRLVCMISPDRLWSEICDEGSGFNPEEVPDPTTPDNLDCQSGRGITLMRSFMSRVEYNTQGNSVVMEKERAKSA